MPDPINISNKEKEINIDFKDNIVSYSKDIF